MANNRPNFLIIVADDLGFSDPGCFGSEIQTPNLDELARNGVRFADFHTAAACSPTRAMLMSGTDHHLVGLGQLLEHTRNSPAHQGKPGHEGYLTSNVATLPEVLKDGGYHTLMSGKWHLGLRREQAPCARGFERAFSLLPGCANHYAWEPQLGDVEQPQFLDIQSPALHIEGNEYVNNSELPEDFYSSDYYVDKMLEYMEQRPQDKPFFAYLPFSAPHWPLQAPKENMDRYKGMYNDGPDALRLRRLASLIQEGLVPENVLPHDVIADEVPIWDSMDEITRAKSSRAMEAYAGMVDRMDYDIGRVISYLKTHGIYENTLILFLSDNGAEGASMEARPLFEKKMGYYLDKYYNNSLDNIGRQDSYVWYGSRWAQAATAPSRLYKLFSTEGGVRVPLIMKSVARQQPSICKEFCTVMDIMPTLLELAGIANPESPYNGRAVVSIKGRSWIPYFTKNSPYIHNENHVTGWELVGQGAIRKGHWKINFVLAPKGPEVWQLYDLSVDPGETNDLASVEKEKLHELVQHWHEYVKETGVVGLKPDVPNSFVEDEMDDANAWMKYESGGRIYQAFGFPKRVSKKGI